MARARSACDKTSKGMKSQVVKLGIVAMALGMAGCGAEVGQGAPPVTAPHEDGTASTIPNDANSPLAVDWNAQDQSLIAGRLHNGGTLVVRWDGQNLSPLYHCVADGKYRYTGSPHSDSLTDVADSAHLRASFPLLSASLGGQVQENRRVRVRMTTVGEYQDWASRIHVGDLQGQGCAGATHFVSGATIGAFEFVAESGLNGSGNARLGPGSADVGGNEQRELFRGGGDRSSCGAARTDQPTQDCDAVLRLQLTDLDDVVLKKASVPTAPHRTLALVAASVGVVALGVATGFAISSRSSLADSRRECESSASCINRQQALSDHDSAASAATASGVLFAAGGAALIGAAILWFAAPNAGAQSE